MLCSRCRSASARYFAPSRPCSWTSLPAISDRANPAHSRPTRSRRAGLLRWMPPRRTRLGGMAPRPELARRVLSDRVPLGRVPPDRVLPDRRPLARGSAGPRPPDRGGRRAVSSRARGRRRVGFPAACPRALCPPAASLRAPCFPAAGRWARRHRTAGRAAWDPGPRRAPVVLHRGRGRAAAARGGWWAHRAARAVSPLPLAPARRCHRCLRADAAAARPGRKRPRRASNTISIWCGSLGRSARVRRASHSTRYGPTAGHAVAARGAFLRTTARRRAANQHRDRRSRPGLRASRAERMSRRVSRRPDRHPGHVGGLALDLPLPEVKEVAAATAPACPAGCACPASTVGDSS